MAIVCGDPE
jgi:uncharacterized transporter YbjL